MRVHVHAATFITTTTAVLALALGLALIAAAVSMPRQAQAQQAASVTIQDDFFSPASVSVPAGSTVTWRNAGQNQHTVTASNGAFNSGTLNPGQTFAFTFPNAGTFAYTCTIHGPTMSGTVTVTAAAAQPTATATQAPAATATRAPAAGATQPPAGGTGGATTLPTTGTGIEASASGSALPSAALSLAGVMLIAGSSLVLLRRRTS